MKLLLLFLFLICIPSGVVAQPIAFSPVFIPEKLDNFDQIEDRSSLNLAFETYRTEGEWRFDGADIDATGRIAHLFAIVHYKRLSYSHHSFFHKYDENVIRLENAAAIEVHDATRHFLNALSYRFDVTSNIRIKPTLKFFYLFSDDIFDDGKVFDADVGLDLSPSSWARLSLLFRNIFKTDVDYYISRERVSSLFATNLSRVVNGKLYLSLPMDIRLVGGIENLFPEPLNSAFDRAIRTRRSYSFSIEKEIHTFLSFKCSNKNICYIHVVKVCQAELVEALLRAFLAPRQARGDKMLFIE